VLVSQNVKPLPQGKRQSNRLSELPDPSDRVMVAGWLKRWLLMQTASVSLVLALPLDFLYIRKLVLKITFNPNKRERALKERGIDFADAGEVFAGRHTVLEDDRFDYGETRFISAGFLRGRMVVIVWTPRPNERRVISMRYCHAREEERWRKRLD
jgi:uncharacterized DUF497 family protein